MLVAYTITDDVRRMTRWLRDTHDLKINCVEFDYYERDDAEMFVPTVIGVGETQGDQGAGGVAEAEEVPTVLRRGTQASKRRTSSVTNRSASSDSWLTIPAGHSDVEFVWHFKGVIPATRSSTS